MSPADETPSLAPWPSLRGLPIRPLIGGLINRTFRVGEPPVAVVQELHPIFAPSVNEDIEAVTAHLAARGMTTPRPVRTEGGGLHHLVHRGEGQDPLCLRALSWVPGQSPHTLREPAMAREAGALVARWHAATAELDHRFRFTRPLAHDTAHHMAVLEESLREHGGHRLREQVGPLAEELLERWSRWGGRADRPLILAHGDLKISNLRFDEEGRGICLLDLDTMGMLPLSVELGDAWRSWCNPATESDPEPDFDLRLFEASAEGYLAERPLPAEELEALPHGVEQICLELGARFAADALNERYFGWSEEVAPTRGEHNLLRAQGQLRLARRVRERLGPMEAILERVSRSPLSG